MGRRCVLSAAALACLAPRPALPYSPLASVATDGFEISVPPNFYRAKGGRALVADVAFVAADYVAGRTATVTRTRADRLLIESGDPIALAAGGGEVKQMRELGKPAFLASLLVRRRDGDPRGQNIEPRTRLLAARAVSDTELRFEAQETFFSATSITSAAPSSRYIQARAIFVPPDRKAGTTAYLLTAWASSPCSPEMIRCEPTPCSCGEGAALSCECPAPKCSAQADAAEGLAGRDPEDAAIVDSLRVLPIGFSLQQALRSEAR